ncbi:hypothetical protein EVJ58_g10817 [Rhodofomes roseus]|uniref:Uncharacterized protein n=1 Tax=Rhodofomes roseus TaxID=34475 RepID=A0A4Y9XLL6_9APHY|nr:hypothetical protein EVJ58_g10817 [Rhodofomes roseus]
MWTPTRSAERRPQVEEELRPLSTPRPTAGAKQKAKGTRATKVNAKAKAKESVQEDEQPPAKKRRMSRGQQAVAGPSVPRQAPQQPIPMPAYSASSSASVQHGKPNSGGPRNGQPSWYPGASAQGTFYNFRVSVQPSSAARSPTTNAARPPVSAPAPAAAPVIPLPAGAAAVPVMLVPDPHEYPTHEALFEELLEHVDQWKTEKTAFRFQGSWMVTIEPNAIIDEQLVRTAAEEVGNLTEMPFRCVSDFLLVVLWMRLMQRVVVQHGPQPYHGCPPRKECTGAPLV